MPLVGQWIWTNHKTQRFVALLPLKIERFIQYHRQALDGFTKAHIIAQAAIEAISTKLGHPLYTRPLVVSELSLWVDFDLKLGFGLAVILGEDVHEVQALFDLSTQPWFAEDLIILIIEAERQQLDDVR